MYNHIKLWLARDKIYHDTHRNLREQNLKKNLEIVRQYMKWKTVPMAEQQKIEVPWANETSWRNLRSNQKWERKQKYYRRVQNQKDQENLSKDKKEQQREEQIRFEAKFSRLILSKGKNIAFHFAKEYRKIKTAQLQAERVWVKKQPKITLRSSKEIELKISLYIFYLFFLLSYVEELFFNLHRQCYQTAYTFYNG